MGWRYLIISRLGSGRVVSHPIVTDERLTRLINGLKEQGYIETTASPAEKIVDVVHQIKPLHYLIVGAP